MNKHELTINYNIVNSKFYKNYTFFTRYFMQKCFIREIGTF